MKVIQMIPVKDGIRESRFVYECYLGLVENNFDVKLYQIPIKEKHGKAAQLTIPNQILDYDNKEMIDDIISADVLLVHEAPPLKSEEFYLNKFFDFIINLKGPRKVMFFMDHGDPIRSLKPILTNKDFIMAFDKIVCHANVCPIYKRLENLVGKEKMEKSYVTCYLPYVYDDKIKENWIKPENKYKRCTYIGRYHRIKHPEQIIKFFKLFDYPKEYEFEIRGIGRTIDVIYKPDFYYEIDPERIKIRGVAKDTLVGPSKYTFVPNNVWREENGFDKKDLLIDTPHTGDKIWMFGEYKFEDGMEAIKKSLFGMEFYRLKTKEEYNSQEYAMCEIIEQGTIAIFDAEAMRYSAYCENGYETDKSLFDTGCCLCLEPDLSNFEEIKEKMEYLANNPEEYEKFRLNAFEVFRKHTDAKAIMKRLVKDCLS